MIRLLVCLGLLHLLLIPVHAQTGRTFYVAQDGDDANAGTEAAPWASLQHAADTLEPGDTVLVKEGTYDDPPPDNGASLAIYRSGTADAWITYAAYPGHQPRIVTRAWHGIAVVSAAYIEINGFIIEGQPDAMSDFSGNGIGLVRDPDSGIPTHHIRVLNNTLYGLGGGGIYTYWADWVTIEGNTIYDTSFGSTFGNSAISMYQNVDVEGDPDAPYRNRIRGNIAYNNRNEKPFAPVGEITDGNCIIIDDNQHTQNESPHPVYTGRTLIENNLCVNNGGRGIHIFYADHVDVFFNTLYQNQYTPEIRDGELTAMYASDITFMNNIVYARAGEPANTSQNSQDITFSHNLYFGTDIIPVQGEGDQIGVDPLFIRPTLDPTAGDFRLQADSPAIDAAQGANVPSTDLLGIPRPQDAADLGAYEWVADS
jgi:hypothetical protein